jgi:riboflavin kinase/FMN adenylyltransferase
MGARMRIFRSLEEVPPDFGPTALTIGNFDGVHAGHRRILRRVREVATDNRWKASVLTFDPHPAKIVAPARAPLLMTEPEQRCALMQEEGIDQVLILPFNRDFAQLSPEQFVKEVLVRKLDARAVLVGENFRFGHKQAGDRRVLQELGSRYGFRTEVIAAIKLRGQLVSSSAVRQLVQQGEVARAARLLEKPFALEGEVVPGHGVGAKQTVPTLNLATRCEVLPAIGVYVTRTRDLQRDRSWPSVSNVGYRPTFGGDTLSIESFLLEKLDDPAPRRIRIEFLWRLRPERKFPSPEALKAQILRDAARAQAYFRRLKKWAGPAMSPVA